MNRRRFLKLGGGLAAILAAKSAPAIISSEVLMPTRNIIVPEKKAIITDLADPEKFIYVDPSNGTDYSAAVTFENKNGVYRIVDTGMNPRELRMKSVSLAYHGDDIGSAHYNRMAADERRVLSNLSKQYAARQYG